MITAADLARLFPTAAQLAAEHRLPGPIHQRDYLVGGEMRWDGACKTVLSPVCTRSADGELRQVEIGSYPLMARRKPTPRSTPRWPPTTTAAATGRP